MDFNLRMLNVWIGLCKGDHGLPSAINELGFKQHAIEYTIRNDDGSTCVPELIAYSAKHSHTLVFEWKSGRGTEEDQLSRYGRLTSKTLVEKAYVPREAAKTFDVVYVCQAKHVETMKIGIVNGSYKFPLLSVDDVGICLAHNQFECSVLNELFKSNMEVNFAAASMSHVPINEKSEDWEVADVVIPRVLERMLDRQTLVRATSICPMVCPLWDNMASVGRNAIQKRVCEVLEQAALGEFAAYLVWRKMNNDCAVDFVHNPINDHGKKRSGALRRLKNASKEFKLRLVAGRKFVREPGLWDDFPRGEDA